jgi:hypothetical protein
MQRLRITVSQKIDLRHDLGSPGRSHEVADTWMWTTFQSPLAFHQDVRLLEVRRPFLALRAVAATREVRHDRHVCIALDAGL